MKNIGAIASCSQNATAAGEEILKSGGNAFDAAVACAFNLMVSNPLMCSIGGGGFAAVKTQDDDVKILDFFDAMPGKGLDKSCFGQNINVISLGYGNGVDVISGHSSIGVPGTVKGLELISKRYGKMPLKEIIAPAIDDAISGVPLNATVAKWLTLSSEKLHWQTTYAKQLLSTKSGKILQAGDNVKNKDLANTFELIGQYGSDIIYKGDIAKKISEIVLADGGIITQKDLAEYQVIERSPIRVKYGDYYIFTNPPPSIGGITLAQMLKVVNMSDIKDYSKENVAKLAKIINIAISNRYSTIKGESTDVQELYKLTDNEYIFEKYKNILPSANTTHLSVVDKDGNCCSITMSMGYGSGVAIDGTGIVMDNVLGELELNPLGFHALTPGDRLVSGMCPTILTNKQMNDLIVAGTPGASRITTALLHTIINLCTLDKFLEDSVLAPRIHWENDMLSFERGIGIDENLIPSEWKIIEYKDRNMFFGGVQCARLKDGVFEAASDPRRSGISRLV